MNKYTYPEKRISSIDLSKLEWNKFLDERQLQEAQSKLAELYESLIMLEENLLKVEDRFPADLVLKITQIFDRFLSLIDSIEDKHEGSNEDDIVRNKKNALQNIRNFHRESFELGNSSQTRLLEFIAVTKGYQKDAPLNTKKYEQSIMSIVKDAESQKKRFDGIYSEFEKKLSESTVSDYAKVFETEVTKNGKRASLWMKVGIGSLIILIATIFIFVRYDVLPTEITNEFDSLIRYSISNAIVKLLIFSLEIYLLTFSAKQYSISKHQQVLNIHRQNALNSYKLFSESISSDDENSRNTLMIQIAKSIYENNQSTGFLNEKSQTSSPGIIELTKIIGKTPQ
ncbi:hypothetical protein [Roseivirga sp. 4D4]|uniref:hypothetical protein n=1 Tax=Roseivirga sp. 4D4 TaxID=1889784 RepID=UPI001112C9E8|nr:hypothetical protein [Roseivirga sp. 4D4]